MKTTTVKDGSFPKFIGIQVATCPECGSLLERNEHPFDKKIPTYLGYPFAVGQGEWTRRPIVPDSHGMA